MVGNDFFFKLCELTSLKMSLREKSETRNVGL